MYYIMLIEKLLKEVSFQAKLSCHDNKVVGRQALLLPFSIILI